MALLRKIDGEFIITNEQDDILVDASELAERFGISVRTVWRYKNDDGMPYIRFGLNVMFQTDECYEWCKQNGKGLPIFSDEQAYLKKRTLERRAIRKARKELQEDI